jgi:hypothetical protein
MLTRGADLALHRRASVRHLQLALDVCLTRPRSFTVATSVQLAFSVLVIFASLANMAYRAFALDLLPLVMTDIGDA